MRYVTIICIIVLLLIVAILYRRWIVSKGYWFCQLSKEFFEVVKKVDDIANNPEIKDVEKVIFTDHIKITYIPNNWTMIFFQYDVIIAHIRDLYSHIENKEKCFRSKDWREVEIINRQFKDEIAHIKYLEWIHGYRKVT